LLGVTENRVLHFGLKIQDGGSSKMADFRHHGFMGPVMGSLKSPCTTS